MPDALKRPVLPTPDDAELAKVASRTLSAFRKGEPLEVCLADGQKLTLPTAAIDLLAHLLTEMSRGNAVTVIPVHAELTTQEAANLLNVSRPYLIRLLTQKKIPFSKVGTHRRIKFSDLEAYRLNFENERRAAMQKLADEAQDMGLGY
jgi:excisionase family DNA binding protein